MFKFVSVLSLLPLLVLASPQYNYPPPSSPTTAPAPPPAPSAPPSTSTQVNVNVGAGGAFLFDPPNLNASVGTLVTFFFPSDVAHSVTQSTFANPCTPLSGANGTGFDSGLQTSKQFTLNVTDASVPIWFFCKAPTHCGTGMVGSINAPTSGSNTYDAFKAAAVQIGQNEVTLQDQGFVSGGVGALGTAAPSASSAPAPSGSGGSPSDAGRLVISSGLGLVVLVAVFGLLA